jgi:hypothetical protein
MTETDLPIRPSQPSPEARAIPRFSNYAVEQDGTVWRAVPPVRGTHAGQAHRLAPNIHPRGHQWCVMLTDDNGKRHRIPVKRLVNTAFGELIEKS